MTEIQGYTAAGFEGVRDAFVANFANGIEVGAAFSAYHRGEKVVDLWGGVADRRPAGPGRRTRMILVFSTTKGATALCANRLAERGELDVDAPVATLLAGVRGGRQGRTSRSATCCRTRPAWRGSTAT